MAIWLSWQNFGQADPYFWLYQAKKNEGWGSDQNFGCADQKFGCLNPHHFLVIQA